MATTSPPSAAAPPPSSQALFEHATAQLAFWQAMLLQIRVDKRRLRLLLPGGGGLAVVAGFLWGDVRVAAGLGVFVVATALMGVYFTHVREQEYLYNVQEAQNALERARAAAATALAQNEAS